MNAKEAAENAARNLAAIEQAKFTAQEVANAFVPQMTEEETLGRLAYEAFLKARDNMPDIDDIESWENTGPHWKRCWIAVAKAVATHVLQEVQASAEASE